MGVVVSTGFGLAFELAGPGAATALAGAATALAGAATALAGAATALATAGAGVSTTLAGAGAAPALELLGASVSVCEKRIVENMNIFDVNESEQQRRFNSVLWKVE